MILFPKTSGATGVGDEELGFLSAAMSHEKSKGPTPPRLPWIFPWRFC